MTVFDWIWDIVAQLIQLMKDFDILYGWSLWYIFLFFLGLFDLSFIISNIFGGSSDK